MAKNNLSSINYNEKDKENGFYSVRNYIFKIILFIQIFIGNLDSSVDENKLKNYFKKKYSSVEASKIIMDLNTGNSKNYGFLYLSDYEDYVHLLNLPEPIVYIGKTLTVK